MAFQHRAIVKENPAIILGDWECTASGGEKGKKTNGQRQKERQIHSADKYLLGPYFVSCLVGAGIRVLAF